MDIKTNLLFGAIVFAMAIGCSADVNPESELKESGEMGEQNEDGSCGPAIDDPARPGLKIQTFRISETECIQEPLQANGEPDYSVEPTYIECPADCPAFSSEAPGDGQTQPLPEGDGPFVCDNTEIEGLCFDWTAGASAADVQSQCDGTVKVGPCSTTNNVGRCEIDGITANYYSGGDDGWTAENAMSDCTEYGGTWQAAAPTMDI